MEKIGIYAYRSSGIEENELVPFPNTKLISDTLLKRGLVRKMAGLCAGPWNMYFSFSKQDSRGVSYSEAKPTNVCHVTVNECTSTYKRTRYFYSFTIVKTKDAYYIVALGQTSRYLDRLKGTDSLAYKFQENELDEVLDVLFENVEKVKN